MLVPYARHVTTVNSYTGLGLAIMLVSESATLARVEPFLSWNTPICWTGFILFADGIVRRVRGNSWLSASPREFAFLALVSIPSWLVFEFYNQFIHNWYYVGLPENFALRELGYAWSFATISPALFEGAELVGALRRPRATGSTPPTSNPAQSLAMHWTLASVVAGTAMLILPFVASPTVATYLAAPVWLGFIFVLDPINDRLGFESITGDWRRGRTDRLINLLLSGALCGILWEFWNFWSRAKWHYTVPIMPNVKIFEMPLPGYLGFPPFAVECFAMYVFLRGMLARLIQDERRTPAGPVELGRPIGL